MTHDLDVHQLIRGYAAHTARYVYGYILFLVHGIYAERFAELKRKIVILNGLEQIRNRIDLVTLLRVLYEICNEYYRPCFIDSAAALMPSMFGI